VTGPSRGEHKIRLAISLAGLAVMAATLAIQGVGNAAAMVEVIGIAGLFIGASAVLSARHLWKDPRR
jgi:hypothetical protein